VKGSELKEKIITHCTEVYQQKLLIINNELKHLSQAIADDTKSSAGDKYETSREMANLEKAKLQAQVLGFNKSLTTLRSLPGATSGNFDLGSLVKTDNEWIFLAVSLGQVEVEGENVLVISPMAPLAQLMMGKEEGETVEFRTNITNIIRLY
jgi:transcription elongation GreA/GreB family factor